MASRRTSICVIVTSERRDLLANVHKCMRFDASSKAVLTIVLCAVASAGLIGSIIVAAQQGDPDHLPPPPTADVPPPPYNRWIRPDTGEFEAYVWDDRSISDEQKAAEPWYDPRWKP